MLEHAVAYATFPNLGKAVTPHAALEVRTGTGDLVWRFDRDGKRPEQVISPQVALDMIGMMNSVVAKRHRAARAARRHPGRRQDRHHQRLSRRLVRRLHRQFQRRGLDRQRRLLADQPHDRRHAPGADLAQHHGLRASGRRIAAACRACRAPQHAADGRRRRAAQGAPAPQQILLTRKGAEAWCASSICSTTPAAPCRRRPLRRTLARSARSAAASVAPTR